MDFLTKLIESLTGNTLPEAVSYLSVIGVLVAVILFVCFLGKVGKKKSEVVAYCKKVSDYLASAGTVTEDNLADFNEKCFGPDAPAAIKQGWSAFLQDKFGYPSEYIDTTKVTLASANSFAAAGSKLYMAIVSVAFIVAVGLASFYTQLRFVQKSS